MSKESMYRRVVKGLAIGVAVLAFAGCGKSANETLKTQFLADCPGQEETIVGSNPQQVNISCSEGSDPSVVAFTNEKYRDLSITSLAKVTGRTVLETETVPAFPTSLKIGGFGSEIVTLGFESSDNTVDIKDLTVLNNQ